MRSVPAELEPGDPDTAASPQGAAESSGCAVLNGSYQADASFVRFSTRGGVVSESRGVDDDAFFKALAGPAQAGGAEEVVGSPAEITSPGLAGKAVFSIEVTPGDRLEIAYDWPAKKEKHVLVLLESNGDFTCAGGTVTFPLKVDRSGGEWIQADSQRVRTLFLNSANDLLVNDRSGPYTQPGSNDRVTEEVFYRFLRVQ